MVLTIAVPPVVLGLNLSYCERFVKSLKNFSMSVSLPRLDSTGRERFMPPNLGSMTKGLFSVLSGRVIEADKTEYYSVSSNT